MADLINTRLTKILPQPLWLLPAINLRQLSLSHQAGGGVLHRSYSPLFRLQWSISIYLLILFVLLSRFLLKILKYYTFHLQATLPTLFVCFFSDYRYLHNNCPGPEWSVMCRGCCEYDVIRCKCPLQGTPVGYAVPCCRNAINECDPCIIHPGKTETFPHSTPLWLHGPPGFSLTNILILTWQMRCFLNPNVHLEFTRGQCWPRPEKNCRPLVFKF